MADVAAEHFADCPMQTADFFMLAAALAIATTTAQLSPIRCTVDSSVSADADSCVFSSVTTAIDAGICDVIIVKTDFFDDTIAWEIDANHATSVRCTDGPDGAAAGDAPVFGTIADAIDTATCDWIDVKSTDIQMHDFVLTDDDFGFPSEAETTASRV